MSKTFFLHNTSYISVCSKTFSRLCIKQIISLCSKANQKLSALARMTKHLTIDERKMLVNSFITAQFNYYVLIWMCHSRNLNNKVNRIQEQTLGLVYNDYKPNVKELLE